MPHLMVRRNRAVGLRLRQHVQKRLGRVRIGLVHEPVDRPPQQLGRGPQNVAGHEQAHGGIQPGHAGHPHEPHAHEHPEARPHVGEHVLAVRDQHKAVGVPPHVHQVGPKRQVGEREPRHQVKAQAKLPKVRSHEQVLHRQARNDEGGNEDERALNGRGKVGDLAVPVGMIRVRRRGCVPQAERRKARGKKMHDRLRRVGQNGRAPRKGGGRQLANQHQNRHTEAQGHGPAAPSMRLLGPGVGMPGRSGAHCACTTCDFDSRFVSCGTSYQSSSRDPARRVPTLFTLFCT